MSALSSIDILIICLYMIGMLALGFFIGGKQKSAETYFLAGRKLLWPVVGLSLFASNISSSSLVGLAGSGYDVGFSVYAYEWMAAIVLFMLALFFAPYYLRSGVFTMPEFLELRYGTMVRKYFSVLSIFMNIFIDTAATLYAGALVIQAILPQFSLPVIIFIVAGVAGLYTITGGFQTVVYTDAVQALLLIGGSIFILYSTYTRVGGIDEVIAITGSDHFKMIKPIDDPSLPWPGLITGVFILGFYFWVTNQFIVQRVLAAKSIRHGQWGALFAGLLKLSAVFLFILPGAYARVLFPEIEHSNQVYQTLLFNIVPHGFLGLIVAGLIAAMMSSVDSAINSASTLLTMDFFASKQSDANPKKLLRIGRISSFMFLILAMLWAPQIHSFPTLWDYLQQTLAYVCPPIATLFIIGIFNKNVNKNGAQFSILVGLVISILSIAFNSSDWMPHYLYVAGINFAICSICLIVVSKAFPAKAESQITWSIEDFKAETLSLKGTPLLFNYRFQGILLLITTLIIILYFQFL
jgi:solute:Na+ symporter, SSS family